MTLDEYTARFHQQLAKDEVHTSTASSDFAFRVRKEVSRRGAGWLGSLTNEHDTDFRIRLWVHHTLRERHRLLCGTLQATERPQVRRL